MGAPETRKCGRAANAPGIMILGNGKIEPHEFGEVSVDVCLAVTFAISSLPNQRRNKRRYVLESRIYF